MSYFNNPCDRGRNILICHHKSNGVELKVKIMKHKLIAVIGALATFTGTASAVSAQSADEFTLSGQSLDVENLTIEDEYKEFFQPSGDEPNISLNSEEFNNYDGLDDGVFYDGDDGVWEIDKHLELQVNEPLSPPIYPISLRPDEASLFGNVDSLELQYDLSE